MAAANGTIQILDPRPEEQAEQKGLSPQLPGLEGKVIGILENTKYHSDAFLEELQRVLETEYNPGKVVYARKFSFSAPCSDETIQALVEECDAVVHGIAD